MTSHSSNEAGLADQMKADTEEERSIEVVDKPMFKIVFSCSEHGLEESQSAKFRGNLSLLVKAS
jgi:hypothetical protein